MEETNLEILEDENEQSQEEIEKKKRNDYRFELVLFFILGFLLGVTLKTEAVKRITIGFDDYQVSKAEQAYNFEQLKQNVLQAAAQQQTQEAAQDGNINNEQE